MSWIDDDKAAYDDGIGKKTIDAELRLYKAGIIAAKAPRFLDVTVECLRADCAELVSKFPHSLEKQCAFSSDSYAHVLSGCKVPLRVLKMQINIPAHCIELTESRRESRDREVPVGSDQIRIIVNDADDLEFYFRSTRYLTPDTLAAGLIRYVRGN